MVNIVRYLEKDLNPKDRFLEREEYRDLIEFDNAKKFGPIVTILTEPQFMIDLSRYTLTEILSSIVAPNVLVIFQGDNAPVSRIQP